MSYREPIDWKGFLKDLAYCALSLLMVFLSAIAVIGGVTLAHLMVNQ